MKRIISFMIAAMLFCSAYTAQAAELGIYIAPKVGVNYQDKDSTNVSGLNTSSGLNGDRTFSFSGGLALGYDLQYATTLPLRVEFEAMWRTSTTSENTWTYGSSQFSGTQKIGLDTYFVNAYYDFYNSSPFVPYAGIGLGFANISQDMTYNNAYSFSEDSTKFAFNVGLGVSWLMQNGFTADMGYRYIRPNETSATFTDGANAFTSSVRPTAHELVFGIRYTF